MSTSQAQSQVPDEIKTLGQPLAIHTGKRNLGMFVLVIAGCCFAALLILLVGLISGGVKPGPGRAIAPVLMLLMGIGGTYLIFTAIRIRNMVYYLCPGGIARQTPGRVEIIPWEGLEVYQRAETHPFGGTNRYWLVHGETKWKLTWDVTEIDAMGKAIAEEMRRRYLASMLEAIQQGRAVAFGPIHLSRQRVHVGDRHLEWERIEAISQGGIQTMAGIRQAMLIWRKSEKARNAWERIKVVDIPNYELLKAVIRAIRPGVLMEFEDAE